MTDKNKWVKPVLAVVLVLSSVIVSYTKLQSNVDEVVKDSVKVEERVAILEDKKADTSDVDKAIEQQAILFNQKLESLEKNMNQKFKSMDEKMGIYFDNFEKLLEKAVNNK